MGSMEEVTRDGRFVDKTGRYPEEKKIEEKRKEIAELKQQLYEKHANTQLCPDCGEEEYRFLICDNCGYSRVADKRITEDRDEDIVSVFGYKSGDNTTKAGES